MMFQTLRWFISPIMKSKFFCTIFDIKPKQGDKLDIYSENLFSKFTQNTYTHKLLFWVFICLLNHKGKDIKTYKILDKCSHKQFIFFLKGSNVHILI